MEFIECLFLDFGNKFKFVRKINLPCKICKLNYAHVWDFIEIRVLLTKLKEEKVSQYGRFYYNMENFVPLFIKSTVSFMGI